ncbi:hypothetical protein Dda_0694 [Drechslerella dactyloides]|uniref:Uncharacterized protein n=1 Tax=Drechslerella dactyloides TaxID=74499 RepID=A0AAD6NN84_DREDA|nr:hypothetical protein Dda_0694 [Drechslerella dactyloides]
MRGSRAGVPAIPRLSRGRFGILQDWHPGGRRTEYLVPAGLDEGVHAAIARSQPDRRKEEERGAVVKILPGKGGSINSG